MSATSQRPRRSIVLMALVAVVAGLAFVQTLGFGFVYDDHWTIRDNETLDRSLAANLRAAFSGSKATRDIPDSTRPAMMASMWLDHRLFGDAARGFHAHSLLLYAACCGLATLSLFGITRRARSAVAAGAFFALFPPHAEVVAAINYREDLIAALGMLVVLAWIHAPRPRQESLDGAVLAGACFGIALLAKESAVALVFAVLATCLVRTPRRAWFAARKKSLWALGIVLAIWGAWRAMIRIKGVDDIPVARRGPLLETLFDTSRYEVRSLTRALFPFHWSPDYAPEPPASFTWTIVLLGWVLVAVLLARRRATRVPAAGLIFALLVALPTSPLVGPVNEFADRFLFLPALGGAIVWGWAADRLGRRMGRRLWPLVVVLPALPLALAAHAAAAPWTDDLTLWSEATQREPESPRVWIGLSRAQRLSGDLAAASASIERALALEPQSIAARVTPAYLRLYEGDLVAARSELEEIRARGGSRQRGFARAASCAEQADSRAAAECIRAH